MAAVRVVVVHVAPVWRLPQLLLFFLLLSLSLLLFASDGPPRFRRDARAFRCSGPEGGDCGP